jgi:hypothetical protein
MKDHQQIFQVQVLMVMDYYTHENVLFDPYHMILYMVTIQTMMKIHHRLKEEYISFLLIKTKTKALPIHLAITANNSLILLDASDRSYLQS